MQAKATGEGGRNGDSIQIGIRHRKNEGEADGRETRLKGGLLGLKCQRPKPKPRGLAFRFASGLSVCAWEAGLRVAIIDSYENIDPAVSRASG